MLSYGQNRWLRWLRWLEGVMADPGNGGYEIETLRAEAVAEINRRDFLGLDSDEVVPTYYLIYREVDPEGPWPPAGVWGWMVHDRDGRMVYPDCPADCACGRGGQGPFCGVELEEIPCDPQGLQEVVGRLGEAVAPTLVQVIWRGVVEEVGR
jgi:hypothetical protein